jgi:tetratricopeptide (TPR) repeat protein
MVDLYNQGRFDEVSAGCELITKMDPMFEPARKLSEKLQNPAAPVDVEALLAGLGEPDAGTGGGSVIDEAKAALAERDFQRVIEICQGILASDPTNPDAQRLGAEAQEKIESEPFVAQFVEQARKELAAGNLPGAKSAIDKACSLDETHPTVLELLEAYAAAESGGAVDATPTFDAGAAFADPFAAPAESPAPEAPASGEAAPEADFSSAFVVDQPTESAPSSDATPASDFGFTFEEEQAAAPEPEPEPAAAPEAAPAEGFGSQEFDFGGASVDVSDDDASKIKQYLAEGDEAYAGGDFQQAIDIWSKIFLIDVTNDEASKRIEEARQKRLEVDQQVEDLIVAGTLAFEKQNMGEAREKFEEVLRLDPTHFNANEYLQKINDMESGGGMDAFAEPEAAEEPESSVGDLYDYDEPAETMAPAPDEAPAAPPPAAKKIAIPRGVILGIVGIFIVLGAAAAWYLTRDTTPAYDPAITQAEFDRASMLAEQGAYQDAISVLSLIDPSDPQHNRALEMIAEYKKQSAQKSNLIDGRPPGEVFQERVQRAREAFAAKNYLGAKEAFESASAIQQLSPDDQATYQAAVSQAAKLDAANVLFTEGRYADAITTLETLLAEDPDNMSIRLLMSNAYFNLGRTALERENFKAAVENFGRVLDYNPEDEIAKRSRDLALRYEGQPTDLLYRIYVKHLPLR